MSRFARKLFPIVAALSFSSHALADPILDQLERALKLLKAKDYKAAIAKSSPLLENLKLDTVEQIILAHKILGVSSCELGDQPKAEEHFKALLTFSPTETIDDVVVTKPCATLYARLQEAENPPPPKPEPSPKKIRKTSPKLTPQKTLQEPTLQDGAWKRLVPFGVGQFANAQSQKGMAFLATEGTAAVTAGVMFGLFQAEKGSGGTFEHPDRANAYRITFWSMVGIGSVAAVWGVVDAVGVYRRNTKPKKAAQIFPMPDGVLLSLSF